MLKLKVVTPEGKIYESDKVVSVGVTTKAGFITVLEDHVPLLSLLDTGEIVIDTDSDSEVLAVSGGVLEVKRDSVLNILADSAESAAEIDLEQAEAAKKAAEEYLAQQVDISDVEFARIQAQIERELAKIDIATRHRMRGMTSRIPNPTDQE